ncbi:universal stress protein [Natronococcus occultus]|uniref:Universal stress protein UspA-like protein n=1 Tax=Natronococcus occultus SP4 TaxID=694430 RepID=L0JVK9_9EURY|nr:universal stress protein [Natronococcus occultus]AGB37072.1 universal stress protein UspA-like protein [Natronococcus occultus SP4]
MTIVTAVEDTERDRRVIAEGAALADAFNDELHVIHVLDRDSLEEGAAADEPGSRPTLEVARDIAADIASLETKEFTPVGRIGSPAGEIQNYTEETEARYLVVGGRKRSPIGKAVFGSITQSLLLNVESTVVTVRTESTS